jgi:hypothetical protein
MSIGKTATRSSRKRVSSQSPASRPKPATYVPFLRSKHQRNQPFTDRNFSFPFRPSPTQKHIPSSRPPRPRPSAPASKPGRVRTRRVLQPRQRQRRSASRQMRTGTSGIRSRRTWPESGWRSCAWRRLGTRPSLCPPRLWASRRRPSPVWRLVLAPI